MNSGWGSQVVAGAGVAGGGVGAAGDITGVPATGVPGIAAGAAVAWGSSVPAVVSTSMRPVPSSIAWYSTTRSAATSKSSPLSFYL